MKDYLHPELGPRQAVTCAPSDFDYPPGTRTVIDTLYLDERGRHYRLIECDTYHLFDSQVARYSSGPFISYVNVRALQAAINCGELKLLEPQRFFHEIYSFLGSDGSIPTDEQCTAIYEMSQRLNGAAKRHQFLFNVECGGLRWTIVLRGEKQKSLVEDHIAELLRTVAGVKHTSR